MKDLMEKGTIEPLVEKYGRYFYENTSLFYGYFQKDDLIIIEEPGKDFGRAFCGRGGEQEGTGVSYVHRQGNS